MLTTHFKCIEWLYYSQVRHHNNFHNYYDKCYYLIDSQSYEQNKGDKWP